MNCTPSLATKKHSLHPNHCRSSHALHLELGCRRRTDFWEYASLPGKSASSKTVLQRCLSSLRYSVLWFSLWNAHRQEGNFLGRSCQRRFASLSQTLIQKIQMLLALPVCLAMCIANIRLLLQPETALETALSSLFFQSDWFLILSYLATLHWWWRQN